MYLVREIDPCDAIDIFTPLAELNEPQVDGAHTPFLQREQI